MKAALFVGPTLWHDDARVYRGFTRLPPASEGDVYRTACKRPLAIGLIDGCFENVPSIWHKEILWALAQGIHVFGSASMGALRAAELESFGMIGVGRIFEFYRSGVILDDDDVAVLHAPAELQFRPLTEAMVDIRATLAAAVAAGVIALQTANAVADVAKAEFFKDREWERILADALAAGPLSPSEGEALRRWLPANCQEQKREDALGMIDAMRRFLATGPGPFVPRFAFAHTAYWQNVMNRYPARCRSNAKSGSACCLGPGTTDPRIVNQPPKNLIPPHTYS